MTHRTSLTPHHTEAQLGAKVRQAIFGLDYHLSFGTFYKCCIYTHTIKMMCRYLLVNKANWNGRDKILYMYCITWEQQATYFTAFSLISEVLSMKFLRMNKIFSNAWNYFNSSLAISEIFSKNPLDHFYTISQIKSVTTLAYLQIHIKQNLKATQRQRKK